MKKLLIICIVVVLVGCVTFDKIKYVTMTNYNLNEKITVPFGGVMISKNVERHVFFTGMDDMIYLDNVEEIIYTAKEADSIRLIYRELRRNNQPIGFSQELIYDLSKSNTIVFRNYHIEILKADNTEISFMVLKD